MKNPPNSSEQALEDYFNDLLGEPAPLKSIDTTSLQSFANTTDNTTDNTADTIGDNILDRAPLSAVATMLEGLPQPRHTARLAQLPSRPAAGGATAAIATPIATSVTALRAYAEPVRTLNLRMPLPQLAPETRPQPAAKPVTAPVAEPVLQPAPLAKLKPAEPPVEPLQPVVPESLADVGDPPAPPVVPTVVVEPEPVIIATGETAPVGEAGAPMPWLDNGRPAWAQQPFECLLFNVGGLGLAAPLAELGSIYLLDPDAPASIFGQADWFMGLLPVKGGGNIRIIDAAQVVMPERYSADMRERYRYAISLHGSDWALAVDHVADSVVLQPDDVRWRSQRTKRPWLAGTVVDRMCALLDVAQLVWMFENQDGKRAVPRP